MGETLSARIIFLQGQLHRITLAIEQARARGDTVALENLRALWLKVKTDVDALVREAHDNEAPAAVLVTLDRLGDEVTRTGRQLVDAGVSIVGGAGVVLKYLPVLLLVGLLVAGLFYAAKLRKELWK